ncbi:MAG TPA: hypothetical protein VNQ76_12795 [Planctomicrobium sp.]|nr:hypothetical protein [Planctomicrobium sp.]
MQSGTGNGALLKVAEGKDITLTFDIDFQGAGGWCLLWGMKGGTGHGFWNHQLRVSGAHNCLISSVDGELKQPINLDTPYEFKGPTRVGLSIQEDGQVTLASGSKTIFSESYDLPDDGDVLIGTWSNQYGPRPIKIHRIHLKN